MHKKQEEIQRHMDLTQKRVQSRERLTNRKNEREIVTII